MLVSRDYINDTDGCDISRVFNTCDICLLFVSHLRNNTSPVRDDALADTY